jgi:hypothetical protein
MLEVKAETRSLEEYVSVAEEALTLSSAVADEVLKSATEWTFRNRVLAGLARKIYLTFQCLLEDARKGRQETFHHLKTLIECFIYWRWVGQDDTDKRARLLWAKGLHEKAKYFKEQPYYQGDEQLHENWEGAFRSAVEGMDQEWRAFKKKKIREFAKEGGAKDFHRIYKYACEPAHVSDLFEHTPNLTEQLTLEVTRFSESKAHVALYNGVYIICIMLEEISKQTGPRSIYERVTEIKNGPLFRF